MRQPSPRLVVLRALGRVEREGAFANLALDAECNHAGLSPRDAAFATELTYGILRRRASLDNALSPWIRSGWASLEPEVRDVLRLGAYQILHTRVPPHAAVAETVATAKRAGHFRAAGLVNAVLRRLAENGAPPEPEDPQTWLEIEGSLPPWIASRLLSRLGSEGSRAFVKAINTPAKGSIRTNLRKTTREALAARLAQEAPEATIRESSFTPEGLLLQGAGSLPRLPAHGEGLFSLQDEAAQLVTHLAGDVEGLLVLDTCAAPGGKSCHLAERGAAEVLALDRNPRKARRIEAEANRLDLQNVISKAGDATEPLPGNFDLVLVDAPCSALGTLRRHPELRYRRQEEDITRMAQIQSTILDRAAEAVRPGGILVYAVCTFTKEEGPDQIRRFLERNEGRFEPAPLDPAPSWSTDGWKLETFPHLHDADAFYAARLRRLSGA